MAATLTFGEHGWSSVGFAPIRLPPMILVVAQSEPGTEVLHVGRNGSVRSDLRQHVTTEVTASPVDTGKVDAGPACQCRA